jgi:PAS domain S-box-containing protein
VQPVTLTRFWHRRICEAVFLMALGVVILYIIPLATGEPLSPSLTVELPIVVLAGLTAVLSFVSYIWMPQKGIFASSYAVYLLLAATTAGLIVTTGGVGSIFIALWMLIAVFAGLFGIWGLLPLLIGAAGFVASEYLKEQLTTEVVIITLFAGLLPLIASFILWHGRTGKTESDGGDRAYKNLASELSEVATKSEVVINAIGDGVIAVDAQGLVQLINPAGQMILGWGKQDALALNYKSVLQLVNLKNEPLDPTLDPVQQVLNTNQQVRDNDLTLITKNGKKVLTSLVISPIGDVGSGAIIVFRDITKEKAEEREQAEFISTASHEMRTPVASIEGYLGLALNPNTATIDEKARDFIMKAHESAQHLGSLFQDLLDVSKAEDGRLSNNPKVVDIMAYTHDILQGLQLKATEKGLRLVFKPNPDDGNKHVTPVYNINVDNDHVREVIDNLTENAIKYTPTGEVTVDITGTDDKVVISVTDSGIGIPAEDIPHLFQKFYRVNNTETNQIGGTGLGLYLCRRLAETMGGRIWLESEYQKGSTFYLELPRIDNQEAARLIEQQTPAAQTAAATAAQAPVVAPAPVVDAANTPPVASPETAPAAPVAAATTVPRGESLTPEQIAAHVAKLKAMVAEQTATEGGTPAVVAPAVAPAEPVVRPAGVSIPVRTDPPAQ